MLHDELLLWLWLRIKRLLGHEVQVRKRRMGVEYVTHGENKTVSTNKIKLGIGVRNRWESPQI